MSHDTDTEYTEHKITSVTRIESHTYTFNEPIVRALRVDLDFEEGFSLQVDLDGGQQLPMPGETARLYGRGFGYPVRGVVIEGRVYWYQTAAEHVAEREKRSEEWRAEREAEQPLVKAQRAKFRDDGVPTPSTPEELAEYARARTSKLGEGTVGYEAAADALWRVPAAAFAHVAHVVGASGFQAEWASMQLLREIRSLKGPFSIVDMSHALYPQHDVIGRVQEFRYSAEVVRWLGDEARAKLAEHEVESDDWTTPQVVEHWRKLVREAEALGPESDA